MKGRKDGRKKSFAYLFADWSGINTQRKEILCCRQILDKRLNVSRHFFANKIRGSSDCAGEECETSSSCSRGSEFVKVFVKETWTWMNNSISISWLNGDVKMWKFTRTAIFFLRIFFSSSENENFEESKIFRCKGKILFQAWVSNLLELNLQKCTENGETQAFWRRKELHQDLFRVFFW